MKNLLDNKNKSVPVKSNNGITHLSGTKTAYLINFQNYRDKIIGSINKHLELQSKQENQLNEDKYANVDPDSKDMKHKL